MAGISDLTIIYVTHHQETLPGLHQPDNEFGVVRI